MWRKGASAQSTRRLSGLIKARRTEELKDALRLWAAEFNRKARGRIKRARRTKVDAAPTRPGEHGRAGSPPPNTQNEKGRQ
jgi:hypothetical protein